MKRLFPLIFLIAGTFSVIYSCNHNDKKESVGKSIPFAGTLTPAPTVVSDNTYTYKNGDTTITDRWTMTRSISKTWPDKPTNPPVDTTKPPTTTVKPNVYSSFDTVNPTVKTMMKNDIGEPWELYQSANNNQITRSTFSYKGGGALKITLRKTDPVVSSRVRAEMTQGAVDSQQAKIMTGENTARSEEWIGFMHYQENLMADNHPFSWLQWHQQENTASPDAATWQRAGYLEILRTTSPNLNGGWEMNPSRSGWYVRATPTSIFPQNKWVAIVIHIKWSSTGQGIWEMWQDGVKVYSRRPGDAGFNGITSYAGQKHYLKLGLYCWKWPDNQDCITVPGGGTNCDVRTVYYDELRRYFGSDGYNVVNPVR